MDALLKWIKTPEAKKIADAAEDKAWNEFQQQFPNADRSKFASRPKPILLKTIRQGEKYFSKTVLAYQQECLAPIGDIGARK